MAKLALKIALLLVSLSVVAACAGPGATEPAPDSLEEQQAVMPLTLPQLAAAELDGGPLRVVATTSIIGDVVRQVGGEDIALVTLMEPGIDPHSYQATAGTLAAAAEADVIFINGWDLEEGLVDDLDTIGEDVPLVPVSANIVPLAPLGEQGHEDDHDTQEEEVHEDEEHQHAVDPHTWLAVPNVRQWTTNIAEVLGALDPENAAAYAERAEAYDDELAELDTEIREQLDAIPEDKRVLVTNHDALTYFADAYGFKVLGTVIPGASTLAEPSAAGLSGLVETMSSENVCTIFSETSAAERLAETVAAELDSCETVQVLPLYTGTLGLPGSGADTYTGMMRTNVDTLVRGLQ